MNLDAVSDEQLGEVLLAMDAAERTDALSRLARDELTCVLCKISQRTLIALGRRGEASLGTYRTRLTKRERVRGVMTAPQTLAVTVRRHPPAFRIDFVKGSNAGRRVLYNAELRRDEIRVKEAGILGFAGALWLHLDNALTRGDTNHRATEVGFGALLDLIEGDMRKAEAAGGHVRRDEGFDDAGVFRSVYDAPPGAVGLYAVSTRIGFDVKRCLPVDVEVYDSLGLLESHRYDDVEEVTVDADAFTPKGAGL